MCVRGEGLVSVCMGGEVSVCEGGEGLVCVCMGGEVSV